MTDRGKILKDQIQAMLMTEAVRDPREAAAYNAVRGGRLFLRRQEDATHMHSFTPERESKTDAIINCPQVQRGEPMIFYWGY